MEFTFPSSNRKFVLIGSSQTGMVPEVNKVIRKENRSDLPRQVGLFVVRLDELVFRGTTHRSNFAASHWRVCSQVRKWRVEATNPLSQALLSNKT